MDLTCEGRPREVEFVASRRDCLRNLHHTYQIRKPTKTVGGREFVVVENIRIEAVNRPGVFRWL